MTEPTEEIEVHRAIIGKHNHQGIAAVGTAVDISMRTKRVALWKAEGAETWETIAAGDTLFELLENVKAYHGSKQT